MEKTFDEINKENEKLASTIVHANITDWMGKVLFESSNYNEVLDKYFKYTETAVLDEETGKLVTYEDDDVQLNSYDDKGINHGIFY